MSLELDKYLTLILWFTLLFFPDLVSSSSSSCSSHVELTAHERITCILVILTIIISLSFTFEWAKNQIEHLTPKGTEPAIHHLWSELSVLGFLSFTFFILSRSDATQRISQHLYGDDEALVHLIEEVHMFFFVCMLIFLAECVALLVIAKREYLYWKELEKKATQDKDKVIKNWWDVQSRVTKRSSMGFKCLKWMQEFDPYREHIRAMEYLLFREKFINPETPDELPLDPSFPFCDYLSLCLGEKLGEIVEIHVFVWVCLEIIIIFVWFVRITLGEFGVLTLFSFVGWFLLLICYIFNKKIEWIRRKLIPKIPEGHSFNPPSQNQNRGVRFSGEVRLCSKLRTEHHKLFWFECHGENVIIQGLGMFNLIISIMTALFGFVISQPLYDSETMGGFVIYLFITFVPIVINWLFLIPRIIAKLTLITSIETMKNQDHIKEINSVLKTQKTLKILKFLHLLQIKHTKIKLDKCLVEKHISPQKEQQLREVFDVMDLDKNGVVERHEIVLLLNDLGVQYTDEELNDLISYVDLDGDGNLDYNEFRMFMIQVMRFDKRETRNEMLERIFQTLDTEGSGSITWNRFHQAISAISREFTEQDTMAVFNEVDYDHDGRINITEFGHLLTKYSVDS